MHKKCVYMYVCRSLLLEGTKKHQRMRACVCGLLYVWKVQKNPTYFFVHLSIHTGGAYIHMHIAYFIVRLSTHSSLLMVTLVVCIYTHTSTTEHILPSTTKTLSE